MTDLSRGCNRFCVPRPERDALSIAMTCAGRFIDSIDSEAMLAIPEELSPSNMDLDLAIAAMHSPPGSSMGHGSARSLCTARHSDHQPIKSQRTDRPHSSTVLDKGPLPHVNLPHLPDIQNDVQARSQVDAAADHSWAHHPSSNPHSYQAFPPQWVNAHSQPRNQQPYPKQPSPHPFKRTATQISYGGAGLPNLAPHMAQHPLAPLPPQAQATGSANPSYSASDASGTPGLSVRQQAVALERLQRLAAELQAAKEHNARESSAHAQTLEEERLRHKEEVQRLRESQQALQGELQSERSATVRSTPLPLLQSVVQGSRAA